jgi:hypothetical protein
VVPVNRLVRAVAVALVALVAVSGVAVGPVAAAVVPVGAPEVGAAAISPVGGAAAPGGGLWVVDRSGRVEGLGGAPFLGDVRSLPLQRPVIGMAATPSGAGYWLVASDGGIFAFGDATFAGSTGGMRLNRPVVGMAATPSGAGYWLVASDGGVFAFGDAAFHGSAGSLPLVAPVAGMAVTPSGGGYWLVAADGGVFAYGDATFAGRVPDAVARVVSIAGTGDGYLALRSDGELWHFGPWRAPGSQRVDLDGPARAVIAAPGGGAWIVASPGDALGVDRVSVTTGRELRGAVLDAALGAARAAGAGAAVVHQATVPLVRVWRDGVVLQAPPPGLRWGLSTLAVDPAVAAPAVVTDPVAAALAAGAAVVGESSAALRGGTQVGDVFEVLDAAGTPRLVAVAAVVPDAEVGFAEMAVPAALFGAWGLDRPGRVTLWGFPDRATIDGALAAALAPVSGFVRVRRSWDPPDPDAIRPSAWFKTALGEFAYRPLGGGRVQQQAGWEAAMIVAVDVPLVGRIRCHRVIAGPLVAAMAEVAAAGLAPFVDTADTRRNGGCFLPREIVAPGSNSGGNLSRHSWGGAFDLNPRTNPFGGRVTMHPGIVEVFRRHGFAWGGGFTIPDGMHFEWVGEDRSSTAPDR